MHAIFLTEPFDMSQKNYVLPRTRIDLYEFCVLWVICLELSSSENENVQVCAWLQSRLQSRPS